MWSGVSLVLSAYVMGRRVNREVTSYDAVISSESLWTCLALLKSWVSDVVLCIGHQDPGIRVLAWCLVRLYVLNWWDVIPLCGILEGYRCREWLPPAIVWSTVGLSLGCINSPSPEGHKVFMEDNEVCISTRDWSLKEANTKFPNCKDDYDKKTKKMWSHKLHHSLIWVSTCHMLHFGNYKPDSMSSAVI